MWFQVSKISFQCEVVDPADVQAIATTVTRALGTYGTPAFTEIIGNCMAQDFSWKVRNLSKHDNPFKNESHSHIIEQFEL